MRSKWNMGHPRSNAFRCVGGVLALLICGCPAAPREVELVVNLGLEDVEVQATLRDIQVWTQEPAEALLAVHQIAGPEAPFAASLLRQYAWLPRLQKWEWHVRGDALDLTLLGSMPRSRFDACAALPPKARPDTPPGSSPCAGFPLWKSGEEYHSILDMNHQDPAAADWTPAPRVATRWPVRADRLETRVLLGSRWFRPSSSSALPPYQLQTRAPEVVASYAALIERQRLAFRAGNTADSKAIQAEATKTLSPEVLSLFQAQTRRERLGLIQAMLRRHGIRPAKLLRRPLDQQFDDAGPEDYAPSLIPLKPPPEVLLLRLARIHDQAAVRFGVDWETGTRDFSSWLDESALRGVCEDLSRKASGWRRPCKHLMHTVSPGT